MMKLDQNPVYRKIIIPWYDSKTACIIMILLMLVVFLFSVIGIYEAVVNEEYFEHIWVPGVLAILSFRVMTATLIRMAKRRFSSDSR